MAYIQLVDNNGNLLSVSGNSQDMQISCHASGKDIYVELTAEQVAQFKQFIVENF